MYLISNYKEVLRKAWSIRLMLLAGLLSGLEVVLPFFVSNLPRGLFAALSMVTTSGAFIARFILQKELQNGKNDGPKAP